MTDATDRVPCGGDLERMLRFLLRGGPRDEGLDSVDETADRLSGAGLETRGQGFEARREDTPGQAITVEGFPARTEKNSFQGFEFCKEKRFQGLDFPRTRILKIESLEIESSEIESLNIPDAPGKRNSKP